MREEGEGERAKKKKERREGRGQRQRRQRQARRLQHPLPSRPRGAGLSCSTPTWALGPCLFKGRGPAETSVSPGLFPTTHWRSWRSLAQDPGIPRICPLGPGSRSPEGSRCCRMLESGSHPRENSGQSSERSGAHWLNEISDTAEAIMLAPKGALVTPPPVGPRPRMCYLARVTPACA